MRFIHKHTEESLTLLSFRVLLHIKQRLFKVAGDGDDLTTAMALDPLIDLWQPLGTLADEILAGKVNDINDRLRRNCIKQ